MKIKIFSGPDISKVLSEIKTELGGEALIIDKVKETIDGTVNWKIHVVSDDAPRPSKTKEIEIRKRKIANTLKEELSDSALKGIISDITIDSIGKETLSWATPVDPEKHEKMLFIGPNGVGKSTMIAKIAAHFTMKGIPVMLATTDTSRVGGWSILKDYSGILGIDIVPIYNEEDAQRVKDTASGYGITLIDSEGISIHGSQNKKQLKYWDIISPDRKIITIAGNIEEKDSKKAIINAVNMGGDEIAFTKLDETSNIGKIIDLAGNKLKLSYCSHGQNIPEDLGWLSSEGLMDLLLHKRGES